MVHPENLKFPTITKRWFWGNEKNLFTNFLSLNENQNILEAIDLIKDFVGESVPVVDNQNNIIGIVTESDLFNQLLIAENIRKKEELSD